MKIVCFYLKRDLNSNVLNTKPFCRDICRLRYRKKQSRSFINFQLVFYIFKSKGQKTLNSVHFGISFGTLVTLISKWPVFSKIYPPLLDYKMLCVLSNNVLVFNSSQGTPCMMSSHITSLTARNTAPPAKSKLATRGLQNG